MMIEKKTGQKGFTLIEILIVIAIVGILAAVAVPSYQESVRKARRSDAKVVLEAAAAAQERWYFQYNRYTGSVDDIGGTSGMLLSPEGYYTVNIDISAGTCGVANSCYVLTAAPVIGGPQSSDTQCVNFSLSHTGARTYTGSSSDCW